MITDFLIDHPWFSPTLLAIIVVAGPFAGAGLVGRPRLTWALTALSLLPVAVLTLVPVDRELFGTCTVQWSLPTPGRVELFANLVLFVPPVLLAGVATRRPGLVLVAGAGLSIALEGLQAALPAIGRACDTNDSLSNTLGALIGALLAHAALTRARRS